MATNKKEVQIGKHTLVFYPDSHRYKLKGEKAYLLSPSAVTGVIDKSRTLINWAVRTTCEYIAQNYDEHNSLHELLEVAKVEWRNVRDEAANKGTAVHAMAEQWIRGEQPEFTGDPQIDSGFEAFLKWQKEHKAEFIETEKLLFSEKHHFAGTTDAIANVDGKITVIDFKTSTGVYPEHYIQLAGYWLALEESQQVDQGLIMHLDKNTGEFTSYFISAEEIQKYKDAFIAALELKKALKLIN